MSWTVQLFQSLALPDIDKCLKEQQLSAKTDGVHAFENRDFSPFAVISIRSAFSKVCFPSVAGL